MVKHDTLLICSGIRENRQSLRCVFADAYHLLEAMDARQMTRLLGQNLDCIAAVLLDISCWEAEEEAWLQQQENFALLQKVPVIILSGQDTAPVLARAFDLGASDVIPLDYDAYAMLRRVETIVDLHLHKQHLESMVAEQKRILRHSSDSMVDALSSIIEYRSLESGQHILRIRHFTRVLLEEVARCCPEYRLTEELIDIICSASALHDIGKIAIPDNILMKPGKLTEAEREIMKTHTVTGCRILESLENITDREYLRYAHNICHYHHERWDGGGYPEGLRGEAIPICAQVVSLADVYDALTSSRVYKEAFSFAKAVNMIFRGECGVFSPKLLDCFKHVVHKFEKLSEEYADGKSPKAEDFSLEPPDSQEQQAADAIEWLRGKYYALVHYINGLLIEVDLDRGLFHLVYNPYQELASLQQMNTLEEMVSKLRSRIVHPEDREKLELFLGEGIHRFLENGLRRANFRLRTNGETPEGQLFDLTLLRINPLDNTRRTLAIVARKVKTEELTRKEASQVFVPMEGTYSCRNDAGFTLVNMGRAQKLLAGYTAEEIRDQMGGSLLRLVHPQDRDLVRREFTRQLEKGSDVRLEHRMTHKDGGVRWYFNHSRLVTAASGEEVICSYLLDIQNLHRDDAALQEKLQRYEMILSQTENVLFEWDMDSDVISFSDTWEKIFGEQAPGGREHWSQQWMDNIYPDDMPLLADIISNLKNGVPYAMTEVRVVTAGGRYIWCRFRATAIRDARGGLQKINGIIINIDAEKQAEQALQSRAEQDPLTKLLNKDAARKQAEEYFSRYASTGGALLILDLDNFKQINDRNGHLFGDTVLVKVAQEIRKIFRGQDIVARIGGDEFMVVMRGVTDRGLLEQRCQKLLQIFTDSFRSYRLELGCSIGIALAPNHGQSYYELFRHADQALYRVKARGKNGYAIYNPEDVGHLNQPGRTGIISTPIDSDKEPGMANDNIVRYAFQKLYSSDNVEQSVQELLGFMGQQLNVSRVYVFENSEDNRFCSNTYEWCNQGITPEIQNLQNLSYETDIPGYADNFDEEGIFYCPDVAILPKNVYDIVAPQGIQAMLHCAIRENGVFRGYIGFDDCREPRLWTREQIELLTFFSEALSMFLLRQRRQEKLQRQARELRFVLDNQDAWIYVVDPDSYTMLHINSRLQEKHPTAKPGMCCYKTLEFRDTPCLSCPIKNLAHRENYAGLIRRADHPGALLMEATKIRWNGEKACLVSGRKIPE